MAKTNAKARQGTTTNMAVRYMGTMTMEIRADHVKVNLFQI